MAMTAMRARSRPYSTMLAPRSFWMLSLAWIHVLRTKRSMMILLFSAPEATQAVLRLSARLRLDVFGIGRHGGWLDRPIGPSAVRRRSVEPNDPHSHRRQDGLGAVPGVELLVDRRQVV